MKNPLPTLLNRRRISIRRILLQFFGVFAGLQVFIVLILQVISIRRKRHQPQGGFPHQYLEYVQVGENTLQLFDYGRELYEAMLADIDNAKESIFLETYIWKDDAIGQEFKDHLAGKAAQGGL